MPRRALLTAAAAPRYPRSPLIERKSARARRCTCQSTCPRCGGTGYVMVPSGPGQVAQGCACRHLDERIALFNQIGIPAAVARASFLHIARAAMEAVARVIESGFGEK